jgi:hypothetical protein
MALMSQRAYARHRGMAISSVQKAISTGRITALPDGQIDSDVADGQWQANTNPQAGSGARRQQEDDQDVFGAAQYTKARAVREHYQARLAKIEYEQRIGNLVSKDEVKIAQFNIDRTRRDHMMNVPDRVCAAIASELKDLLVAAGLPAERANAMDMSHVHGLLAGEIRTAQKDYADSLAD